MLPPAAFASTTVDSNLLRLRAKATPAARRYAAEFNKTWPNPAGGRSRVRRSPGRNRFGEEWVHRHIRQVMPDDRFDVVWLMDGGDAPTLETEPLLFVGLVDFYDDLNGKLTFSMQDIVPLEMRSDGSPFIDDVNNFVGTISRGANPLDHLDSLSIPADLIPELIRGVLPEGDSQ